MPEVTFDIVWPDGSQEQFYSPSTVVNTYFQPGQTYTLSDFVRRSQESLNLASERVRQTYGSPCALAIGQLRRIENKAADFADQADAQVKIL
ncbi:MAG: MSMEG_0570 family nitrogen starvation response protein [Limnothrix sp.]